MMAVFLTCLDGHIESTLRPAFNVPQGHIECAGVYQI